MEVYEYIEPQHLSAPILISIPHAGTFIPDDILDEMNEDTISGLDDTDWFVDRLYSFVVDLGLPILKANYSRLVVDLNRSADNTPLYSDGRLITDLVPETTFEGDLVYSRKLEQVEIQNRVDKYYLPYHNKIQKILSTFLRSHKQVLLFDAHSIRNLVPSISQTPIADLILSDQMHASCNPVIFNKFLNILSRSDFNAEENSLFKGGHITRSFGNPQAGRHAMQLEMTKTCYMDDSQTRFNEGRASRIQNVLESGFSILIEYLA